MAGESKGKRATKDSGWRPGVRGGGQAAGAGGGVLWRAADQTAGAGLVFLALAGMGVYWVVQGGPRGGLVEIDRAAPLVARFKVDINAASWPGVSQVASVGEAVAR